MQILKQPFSFFSPMATLKSSCFFCLFLWFFSISNAAPLSTVAPNWGYRKLAAFGDYIFASPILYDGTSDRGFLVVNVSDPAHMRVVGDYFHLPKGGVRTLVSGHFAYTITINNPAGPEFYVIDVSNPENLTANSIQGTLELGATPKSMVLGQNKAYVVLPTANSAVDELAIIDITQPTAPILLSKTAISRPGIIDLDISGNYLFAVGPRQVVPTNVSALRVIDVTDPMQPSVVGSCDLGRVVSSMSLKVVGTRVYVGDYDGNNVIDFSIVDISVPAVPVLIKTMDMGSRPLSIRNFGSYLILTYEFYNPTEIEFIENSNPLNPARIDGISVGVHVYDSLVIGNTLFIATEYGNPGRIQSFDISRFTKPNVVAPTVSFDPIPYATQLSGTIQLLAQASDDIRVAQVQFYLDGNPLGAPVLTQGATSSYQLNLLTTSYAEGPHSIGVQAIDNSGNLSTMNTQSITINNVGGDIIPPTIRLIEPTNVAVLANYVLLKAEAEDNSGLKQVEFFIDGQARGGPVTVAPYVVPWDTSQFSNGVHTVMAKATDVANQTSEVSGVVSTNNNLKAIYARAYPTPLRTRYVAPTDLGNGDGSTENNAMSLLKAISSAQAGDLNWLLSGRYVSSNGDVFALINSGTLGHPIVWRAMPDQHVELKTGIKPAAYNWLWGLDITGKGMTMSGDGVRLINNSFHDTKEVALGGGMGTEMVIYGNTFYTGQESLQSQRGHHIYTHNDFEKNGYQYFVNNIILDGPKQACNAQVDANGQQVPGTFVDCFIFHAYTENTAPLSGYYMEKNIIAATNSGGSRFLIGGFGNPADREVLKENYFYKVSVQFGYRRPTQVEFQKNYLGVSALSAGYFWGKGEIRFNQKSPNVIFGNKIFSTAGGRQLDLRTSAYTTTGRLEGVNPFEASDVVDENTYGPSLVLGLDSQTDGQSTDLVSWQQLTESNGNKFDAHSLVTPLPTGTDVFVTLNDYDPKLAHVALFNWGHSSTVSVDLSAILKNGKSFMVYRADQRWGVSLLSGVYSEGLVTIPTSGSEFLPLIVLTMDSNSLDTAAPSVPVLTGKAISSTKINLSWTAAQDNVGVVGHKIYRNGVYLTTVSGVSFDDAGLVIATAYDYAVTALDAVGNESAPSATVSVTTLSSPTEAGPGSSKSNTVFSPTRGEKLQVGAFLNGEPGTIDILNRHGEVIFTIGDAGSTSEWNGRNQKGDVVSSGIYLVRFPKGQKKVVVVK